MARFTPDRPTPTKRTSTTPTLRRGRPSRSGACSTPASGQKALLTLACAIERNGDRLAQAQSRNTGQIKHLIAREEVATSVDQIRFFAGAARCLQGRATAEYMESLSSSIHHEPLGVVGQVTP